MGLFETYDPDGSRRGPRLGAEQVPIREAQSVDLRGAARLSAERNGSKFEAELAKLRREHGKILSGEDRSFLVAEYEGEIVAFGRTVYVTLLEDAPANSVPPGWYLGGVVVAERLRRRGLGHRLTVARLRWLASRTDDCYFVVNERNRSSIDLHLPLGFEEVARDVSGPNLSFTDGVGVLLRAADLRRRFGVPK